MNNVIKETRKIRTCFVSAPAGTRLNALRESLLAHGIRPLVPQDLFPGDDWTSEIQRQLKEADLVVGILPSKKQSPWVLFELGQAWALGKRILLIASPNVDLGPYSLQRFLVLRTTPGNREAIDFALDQLLSSPADAPSVERRKSVDSSGLAMRADSLLDRLALALQTNDGRLLESIVAEAIRESGADVVVESPERDRGADLAVWSDVLQPFVGNPLLIETKLRINDRHSADVTFRQIDSFLGASGTKWGLLIFGDGPDPEEKFWRNCPPNVLVIPATTLFNSLRNRAFPEVVRDLRNRRVHSVRP